MHEPYDDDEDDYDEKDNHKYPYNPYQWYYQFDISSDTPFSQWISEILKNSIDIKWHDIQSIPGFKFNKLFPVNSYFPYTEEEKTSLYLGNNYYNEGIWKHKTFIHQNLQKQYVLHLQSNINYFLHQPRYYKGLHEILN